MKCAADGTSMSPKKSRPKHLLKNWLVVKTVDSLAVTSSPKTIAYRSFLSIVKTKSDPKNWMIGESCAISSYIPI